MNKIILVGNGFDLSLGLKTHYKDFLTHLFKTKLLLALDNPDPRTRGNAHRGSIDDKLVKILLSGYYSKDIYEKEISSITNWEEFLKFKEEFKSYCQITCNSFFLKNIYNTADSLGWVDLEHIYFKLLLRCVDGHNDINKINEEKEIITNELEAYLKIISEEKIDYQSITQKHKRIFYSPIELNEIAYTQSDKKWAPENIYLINFNYTPIIPRIAELLNVASNRPAVDVNSIHGKINDKSNPIIFGYGDEEHEHYRKIEEMNINAYLDHIKSFDYLRTLNYRRMLGYLNSSYIVYIYGHSCGLSDRIMLKQIFENKNCHSIKIFYHERPDGTNDFRTKCQDISRHFTSNSLMRQRIIPFEQSEPLPQLANT